VWPNFIVVLLPVTDFGPSILQPLEPILIQAVVSELSVKAFHKRVRCRLSGLNKLQLDIPALRPEEHSLARELRSVVADNERGLASLAKDLFREPRHSST